MADIVISEFMHEDAVASLRAGFSVLYDPTLVDDPERLRAELGDARGLVVRNRTIVDAALLGAAPRLEVVGRLGVGLDNIDLDACEARGVPVYPASGANAVAVAEYVIGTMLILIRGAYWATADIAAGAWPRTELLGHEVSGRQLGLIGFGRIARAVAERAAALSMHVVAHDPYLPAGHDAWEPVARIEFDDLLATSDVISIHVPLTQSTHHLIGKDAIARMRSDAVLVNTSRGGIIDEVELVAALREGRLGGAALDVFEEEPPAHPARFAGVPNLLLTPHIAGLTHEANRRVGELTAENVRRTLLRAT